MKLKHLFLLLASHNQKVEVFYTQENRDDEFGFKINNVDSRTLRKKEDEILNSILEEIENEINEAFLNSDLIEKGEGATSYFLNSDGSSIKQAQYFDWASETDQIWIEEHETEFIFGNIDLPFNQIIIHKDSNGFIVDKEIELQKLLAADLYNRFITFYKELLNPFQVMEMILQLDLDEEGNLATRILNIKGAYQEKRNFDLLDKSTVDFNNTELKNILKLGFQVNETTINKLL